MSFLVFKSGRLEELAEGLADRMRTPPVSPFQPEWIIVQSQALAAWLKLELARRLGVCAHCRFLMPADVVELAVRAVVPETSDPDPYLRGVLTWRIMRALPALVGQPGCDTVSQYLDGDAEGRRRFELARKTANLFDQYLVYRPELIEAWDHGQDEGWQARLWRLLTPQCPNPHPMARRQTYAARISSAGVALPGLPGRIMVFAVLSLPPVYLEILNGLARHLEVHWFDLEPCGTTWEEYPSWEAVTQTGRTNPIHPLLTSMGKAGWERSRLLHQLGASAPLNTRGEVPAPPAGSSLLGRVQHDISLGYDRAAAGNRQPVTDPGRSIQVHSCHSPMREMEVLYDHLLEWFAHDDRLQPSDILVATPDIAVYAPFIEAVFDCPENEARRIPFRICDSGSPQESPLIVSFLKLLDLAESRLPASAALDLLEAVPVRQRFGLEEADLEVVRRWVDQTRIRWGRDAGHRDRLGLPAVPETSWRHGLDRLLLGYAMAGGQDQLVGSVLPADAIEGDAAIILGRFVEFAEALLDACEGLALPRLLSDWAQYLSGIVAQFFAADEAVEADLQRVRSALEDLGRYAISAGIDEPVSLTVLREHLETALAAERSARGYFSGKVTFASLQPMQGIPFKIICLVGMNSNAFPRPNQRLSFDLMGASPRLGDRSIREEDRHLFLSTLLAARERFYLSFVGQSNRSDHDSLPSVLVTELLEALGEGYGLEPTSPGLTVVRHRLQAFSPAYFDEQSGLFSYSEENCRASQTRAAAPPELPAFLPDLLPPPDPAGRQVQLEELIRFFGNPARFLVETRLGLRLPDAAEAAADRESFVLDALDGYQLRQRMVQRRLDGTPLADLAPQLQATGWLPLGQAGQASFHQLCDEVEDFCERLRPFAPGPRLPPLDVDDLALGPFRLSGRLEHLTFPGLLLRYRCARVKAKDLLGIWLEHLLCLVVSPPGYIRAAVLIGQPAKDKTPAIVEFGEVADPAACLRELLELYWLGLTQPLLFFPESSRVYAETLRQPPPRGGAPKALEAARKIWQGSDYSPMPPERDDPYFRLCFKDREESGPLLDPAFARLATAVFDPLLAAQLNPGS